MTLTISLISLKQNAVLDFPNGQLLYEFAKIFKHHVDEPSARIFVEKYQVNSNELKGNLHKFLSVYGKQHVNFKRMINYLSILPEGQIFVFASGKIDDTEIIVKYWKEIKTEQERLGITADTANYSFENTLLFTKYNMQNFGTQRTVVGGGKDKHFKCRFCGTLLGETNHRGEVVTFKNKAHAISEALGNKCVEIRDECDSCNKFFSETIEPSLVHYLSFFRSLHGLEGKGGQKKLIGNGFVLDPELVAVQYDGTLEDNEHLNALISEHELKETIVPQDIYRCLVKFVLSVLPKKELSLLSQTISWVGRDFEATILPELAMAQHSSLYTEKPLLLLFLRKVDDKKLPALVGEFHYSDIIFVFIVPFNGADQVDFSERGKSDDFWVFFQQSRPNQQWNRESYLSIEKVKIKVKFKVEGIEIGKNAFVDVPETKTETNER